MPKLQSYNGRFCESEYENAFLAFLCEEGWEYLAGSNMERPSRREVLYADDLEQFPLLVRHASAMLRPVPDR